MLLATSVPPRFSRTCPRTGRDVGLQYLEYCINSWRKNGFKPVSFNRPDEVAAVEAFGVIDCKSVPNDEAREPTKYGPCLGALFNNVPHDEPLAIVNADVYMLIGIDLANRLSDLCQGAVVAARRLDVPYYGAKKGKVFELGYDLFALRPDRVPKSLANAHLRRLQLGMPWWDYAFPYSCSEELPSYRISEPLLLHQLHQDRWDPSTWGQIGIEALRACPSLGNKIDREAWQKPNVSYEIARAFINAIFEDRFAPIELPLALRYRMFGKPTIYTDMANNDADRLTAKFSHVVEGFSHPLNGKRDPIGRKFKRAFSRMGNHAQQSGRRTS